MTTKKKKDGLHYPTSDDPAGKFYIRLGVALGEWQMVELWLFHLYWLLIGSPDKDIAAISFYQLNQFRKQLEITNELAKFRLKGGQLNEDWGKLHDRIFRAMRRRNEMVHTSFITIIDGPQETLIGIPPLMDPRYRDNIFGGDFPHKISQKAFTSRRLEQYHVNFLHVRREMFVFFGRIRTFLHPPEASS